MQKNLSENEIYALILACATRVLCGFRRRNRQAINLDPAHVATHAWTALHNSVDREPNKYNHLYANDSALDRVLYRFAYNSVRDLLREEAKHHKHRVVSDVHENPPMTDDPRERFRQDTAAEERFEEIKEAVSERDWKVISMLRMGNTPQLIADKLDMSVASVYQVLSRAKKKMSGLNGE